MYRRLGSSRWFREDGLLGSFGLVRAVLHRARSDVLVVLAAWLLVLCATTLVAASTLYADTVATGGLRQAVAAADPATRGLGVRRTVRPADLAAADATIRPLVTDALAPVAGEVDAVQRSDPLTNAASDPATTKDLVVLASFERLDAHATLTAGRWARPGQEPLEATLSRAAATALGVDVGGRVDLVDIRDTTVRVAATVVGTWQPNDPTDSYWRGDALELAGEQPGAGFVTRGPVVVAAEDLAAHTGEVIAEWRGLVPLAALTPDSASALRASTDALATRVAAALPAQSPATVTTGLPQLLDTVNRAVAVSRSSIVLLTLQFGVLAVYGLLLVAGMLLERRRGETALVRSRGASTLHLVAMAGVEAVLLAIPAVVLAPLLAIGVVRLLALVAASSGASTVLDLRLGSVPLAAAAVAGAVSVLALVLPTAAAGLSGLSIRGALGRPLSRTLAQRAGVDVALVAVAAVGLWQLRLYGAPLTRNVRGTLGADPLLVATPAAGLIAGGVLAVRLLPRLAEIAERILDRSRGLVSPLGARQLARRPLRYTRAALLLVLAVALGTFAGAYAATWSRSQADQAAYQAASDARVVVADYPTIPGWAMGSALRSIPGVSAAMPVTRRSVDVGTTARGVTLLGLDGAIAGTSVTLPASAPDRGLAGSLHTLAAARPTFGVPVAGVPVASEPVASEPVAMSVVVDVAVTGTDGSGSPTDIRSDPGVHVAIVVVDGNGRVTRLRLGDATFGGGRQVVTGRLANQGPGGGAATGLTGPVRLAAVEVGVDPEPGFGVEGTIDLGEVSATDAAGTRSVLPLNSRAPGWQWLRFVPPDARPYEPPDAAGRRIRMGQGGEPPVFGSQDASNVVFRLWDSAMAPSTDAPVAVIAGDAFLAATGTRVGDTISVSEAGNPLRLTIVGSTDAFPPLDPAVPFVLADGPSLDADRFVVTGDPEPVAEWWIRADDAAIPAIANAVTTAPISARSFVARTTVAAALSTDPVSLGVVGALALGALAAVVFATIGFLVNVAVSTTEREGELAVFRALGLSGRQALAWLSTEAAVLLVVGLAGGAGLGLLLAWLVLPFATLTPTGAPAVPPPVVVVPFAVLVLLYAGALLLLVATVVLVTRQVPRVHLASVLRGRDE